MKKMNKLLALVLAMVMVLGLATVASATDITIDGGAEGSVYSAWKLLNATDGGEGKFAYTINNTYRTALETVTRKTDDAEIVAYISVMASNGDDIRAFADAMYAQVKGMNADKTSENGVFTGVDQGYYLIAETTLGDTSDTYSLVMLDTAGQTNITVDTKEDKPTLTKKVKETNDSTGYVSGWQDGADYDVNDAVPFMLTGTVSNKYASYKTYYYAFHDKMSNGLTFIPGSVVVKIDDQTVSNGYTVVTDNLEAGCTFEVVFADLKTVVADDGKTVVTPSSKITVEFSATLNDGCVIGKPGNPNEAKLEYNNNPYYEDEGKPDDTSETPWDKVIVFTYKADVNKVDKEGNALEGAGFTLYKWNKESNGYVEVKAIAVAPGQTTFKFERLDAGQYKLEETTVPAGYNKAEDVIFTIEAAYDTDATDPELKTIVVKDKNNDVISDETADATFSVNVEQGKVVTSVVNNSGTELPSTGGIGTTIFYVLGGMLVVCAVVLMVSKKRMSAEG